MSELPRPQNPNEKEAGPVVKPVGGSTNLSLQRDVDKKALERYNKLQRRNKPRK